MEGMRAPPYQPSPYSKSIRDGNCGLGALRHSLTDGPGRRSLFTPLMPLIRLRRGNFGDQALRFLAKERLPDASYR